MKNCAIWWKQQLRQGKLEKTNTESQNCCASKKKKKKKWKKKKKKVMQSGNDMKSLGHPKSVDLGGKALRVD